MINLIPPTAQKQVKREYWIRVASVWIILIASACVVVAVLNAPSYVLVKSQLASYLQEYNQASLENESFKESEEAVVRSNEIATLLSRSDAAMPFSELMSRIESQAGPEVELIQYTFRRKGNEIESIIITGEADSRLALSIFFETIQKDPLFLSATLPLSNLAEDRNIPFTITVTPNKNTAE